MILKTFFLIVLLISSLKANNCAPYFDPNKFYEAPEYLIEKIEEYKIFSKITYKDFQKEENFYIKKDAIKKLNELSFPIKNGIWKFSIKDKYIDELYFANVEYYIFAEEEIANELNENFEGYWSDWIEDGYSMQLVPEQTLFRYKNHYFSFSVFIYGIKGDATKLKNTSVNYYIKNYTKEVNEFIECSKIKRN